VSLLVSRIASRRTVAVVLLVAGHLAQLSGQVLRGSLLDSATHLPVEGARVVILNRPGDTVSTDFTGDDGVFLAEPPRWGTFVVSIQRLGYRPLVQTPVELIPGDTVDITYYMQPLAYSMEPVVVKAEALVQLAHVSYLHREGFYRRQRRSYDGRFLDPAATERRRVLAKRADDFLLGHAHVTRLNRSQLGYRLRCGKPTLFIDGRLFIGDELDQAIDPTDVLAMEIYDGSYMYNPLYGGCSVVVWTKRRAETGLRPN